MSYKTFAKPGHSDGWSLADWEDWAIEQGVLINVWPDQPNVCRICWGTTGVQQSGDHYETCYNCGGYSYLAGLIPVSYSWHGGLEGMLSGAKNDPQARWLNLPLAAVLAGFLERHWSCIERRFGAIDLVTILPSNPSSRGGWDHLRDMYERVQDWPGAPWRPDLLAKTDAATASSARGILTARFEVTQQHGLWGKRVLLIDDTWTSGGTMLSAASTVSGVTGIPAVDVTLGRQVYTKSAPNYLVDDINSRLTDYRADICAVHAGRR